MRNRFAIGLMAFLIMLLMSFFAIPERVSAETIASGTTGENNCIRWSLNDQGLLAVTGPGAIPDYEMTSFGGSPCSSAPWSNYCSSITSIVINTNVSRIGNYAFWGCSSLESIDIPNSVESIGNYAFVSCSGIKSITIPDSVKEIGEWAFYSCSELEEISIPEGVEEIKTRTFDSCIMLEKVQLPSSVTSVGEYAFARCHGLTNIYLSKNVESIGTYAFCECSSLRSVFIPNNVKTIDTYAFAYCSNLADVDFDASVSVINNYVFYHCDNLKTIIIANGIQQINSFSFAECPNINTIVFPQSIEIIEANAFFNCTAVPDIYYGGTWGNWLFINIGSGNTILDSSSISYGTSINNAFTSQTGETLYWSIYDNGCFFISGRGSIYSYNLSYNFALNNNTTSAPWNTHCNNILSVVIGCGITNIGSYAFYDCSNLVSTLIPDSVTSIGERAFSKCTNLANVSLPEGLLSIGASSFEECTSLASICFPRSLRLLDSLAFCDCSGLIDIVFSNGLQSINNSVFAGCSGLIAISLPDGLQSIGAAAFSGCSNLTSVDMPRSVQSIGGSAFSSCTNLLSVDIPDGIQTIAISVFESCTSLTNVRIPQSVKSIDSYAFRSCNSLSTIYYDGTEEDWKKITIGSENYCLNWASKVYAYLQGVRDLQDLINNIGTVTYSSESWDKILTALLQYESLSDAEKSEVSNYSILSDALTSFEKMEKEQGTSHVVLITSRMAGNSLPIVPVSGGGVYYSIRGCDITAYKREGFVFKGWYLNYGTDTEEQFGSETEYTIHLNPTTDMNVTAVYEAAPEETFSISIYTEYELIPGSIVYHGDENLVYSPGETVTASYKNENRYFLYWVDERGNVLSFDREYTFMACRNLTIYAYTKDKGTENVHGIVVFEGEDGSLIACSMYNVYTDIKFPDAPDIKGKEFTEWSMTQDEILEALRTSFYVHVKAQYSNVS